MSSRPFITFVILVFIISGCQTKEKDITRKFDLEINTSKLETFKIPPVLFKEKTIICTDDFLLTNSATKETVFRVFDRNTLEYLGGFGTSGEGPGEYNTVASSIYSPYGNAVHIGSFKNNRIVKIAKDAKQNIRVTNMIIEEHKTPGELVPFNWSFKLNDTTFVGDKFSNLESELAFYTITDGSTGTLIPYPGFEEGLTGQAKYLVYQKKLRVSRDQSKIVMAYVHYPLIRIYDSKTKETKNVFVEVKSQFEQTKDVQLMPDGRNINFKDLFSYYINLEVTEKYIYAQLLVQGFEDNSQTSKMYFPSELHVFNLQGEPILKVNLEDWMFTFAPSQDDEYLYFWHSEIEDELYRLPIGDHLPSGI